MTDSIIKGIAEKLRTVYGADYNIYTEVIEQGMLKPCFFIESVSSFQSNIVCRRYKTDNTLAVHYFSDSRNANKDCGDVASELLDLLEYITVDGNLCRGTKMESKIESGVLLFFVNYNMFVMKKKEPDPNMERIGVNAKAKTDE